MKRSRWWLLGLVLAACNVTPNAPLTGVWRSLAAEVTLTEVGGDIVFGCAFGRFKAPIRPDANGEFKVNGTFTLSSPVQPPGPPPASQAAVYTGKVVGNTMTFGGTLENGSLLSPVTVVKDGSENVVICA